MRRGKGLGKGFPIPSFSSSLFFPSFFELHEGICLCVEIGKFYLILRFGFFKGNRVYENRFPKFQHRTRVF